MNGKIIPLLVLLALANGTAYADSATRTSAFEYDPATGLLTKEIIEPDNSALCLVTTYTYDAYGNKASATNRNCNGSSGEAAAPQFDPVFTSRTSSTSFAATTANPVAGQFPTTSTNALGQSETKEFDPRFGTVTKLTGPNGLVTAWTYDGFGRKATETRADGTTTAWTYNFCGICAPNTGHNVEATSPGAPTSAVVFDSLNREIRSRVTGFDGVNIRKDTEYDALGRVSRVSLPYYAIGGTPVWTTFTYDDLGRVKTQTAPDGAVTTTVYNGLTVSVTNALNQTETRLKNSQGQLIRVTRGQ
jgi:YD repeat-containing protein